MSIFKRNLRFLQIVISTSSREQLKRRIENVLRYSCSSRGTWPPLHAMISLTYFSLLLLFFLQIENADPRLLTTETERLTLSEVPRFCICYAFEDSSQIYLSPHEYYSWDYAPTISVLNWEFLILAIVMWWDLMSLCMLRKIMQRKRTRKKYVEFLRRKNMLLQNSNSGKKKKRVPRQ